MIRDVKWSKGSELWAIRELDGEVAVVPSAPSRVTVKACRWLPRTNTGVTVQVHDAASGDFWWSPTKDLFLTAAEAWVEYYQRARAFLKEAVEHFGTGLAGAPGFEPCEVARWVCAVRTAVNNDPYDK